MQLAIKLLELAALLTLYFAGISDLQTRRVSNRLFFFLCGIGVAALALLALQGIWWTVLDRLLGFLVPFSVTLIVTLLVKKGGGADIKLQAGVGWCFGLFALMQALILVLLFSFLYALYQKVKNHTRLREELAKGIPFVSFLFLGMLPVWAAL